MSLLLAALLAIAQPAGHLERSRALLADADFEGALTAAELAEVEATDPAALALVYRQQGLVREVLGRPDHAMIAFARAIRCDPSIDLDRRSAKRSTVELFTLARALHESGADIVRVRQRLEARTGRDETLCTDAPRAITARAPARASSPPWPVWALGGLAVASGVTGAIVGTLAVARDDDCKNQLAHETYAACAADATRLEIGANVAWSTAGIAAAAAVFIAFVAE